MAILVTWTVTNQGSGDTAVSSWQDSVSADTGATLDQNAISLGSFTHNGLLEPGATYSQSQLVTIPISLSGAYNLFVETDSNGQVYETNTSNNDSAPLPITITGTQSGGTTAAPIADLQVVSVAAPNTARNRRHRHGELDGSKQRSGNHEFQLLV